MTVTNASLDDWQDIKVLVHELQESRFSAILGADINGMECWLHNSKLFPQSVGLLLLRWEGRLVGLCALMAVDAPEPGSLGLGGNVRTQRHGFIHSVYIAPYADEKVPQCAGQVLLKGIEQWARERGAVYLYGNVRLDGRFGALWRKFGLSPQHGVIGRAIPSTQVEELPGFELHHVVVGKELHG